MGVCTVLSRVVVLGLVLQWKEKRVIYSNAESMKKKIILDSKGILHGYFVVPKMEAQN